MVTATAQMKVQVTECPLVTGAGRAWYGLGSCVTCLGCELSQDQIPDPPDFFWLVHAVIVLVLCVILKH